MEKKVGSSGILSRLRANIDSRYGAIVAAVVEVADSVATIGLIIAKGLASGGVDVSIIPSLVVAFMALVVSVGVLVAEIIVAILARKDEESRKRAIQIFDIFFSIAGVIIYVVIGIVCGVFAVLLGTPSGLCNDECVADSVDVLSTVAALAGLSFIQAASFGYITIKTIYTIVKSKN